jgi:outer membrane protein TolC
MFEQGLTTTGEVFRVNRLLLDAQLEAATSAKDRTKLLQEALQVAKRQEELATTQLQAGAAGPLVPLEAKAERLRVEIQLSEITTK